jgi:hypothetical protein
MNERLLWIGGLAAGGVALAAGLAYAASKQSAVSSVSQIPTPGGITPVQTGVPSGQIPVSTPITAPVTQTPTPVTPVTAPVVSPVATIPPVSQTGPINRPSPVTVTNPTPNPVFTQPPPATATPPATSNFPSNTQSILVSPGTQGVSIAANTDTFLTLPSGAVWVTPGADYIQNTDSWPQNIAMAPPVSVGDLVRQQIGTTPIEFTYIGTPVVANPYKGGTMVSPPINPIVFWMDAMGNRQTTVLQINSFYP